MTTHKRAIKVSDYPPKNICDCCGRLTAPLSKLSQTWKLPISEAPASEEKIAELIGNTYFLTTFMIINEPDGSRTVISKTYRCGTCHHVTGVHPAHYMP